jgi:hypothetical protein
VVKNGVIVLQGAALPEGAEVEILLPAALAGSDAAAPGGDVDPRRGDEWEREE